MHNKRLKTYYNIRQMADLGGLQLLPETRKKIEVHIPGQNKLVVLVVVFLALILGLYFGLGVYKQGLTSSLAGIDDQLADLEQSRDKKLEASLLGLRKQLSVVNPLLSAHLFWSGALTAVQNATQPQVQFQSINADVASKKIVVRAIAANYTTVARQIAAFYAVDSITDIILNKVQIQPAGRLEVTIQINFDADKFLIKR